MTSSDISEFLTLPRSEYDALKLRGNTYSRRALMLVQQVAFYRTHYYEKYDALSGEIELHDETRNQLASALRRAEAAEGVTEAARKWSGLETSLRSNENKIMSATGIVESDYSEHGALYVEVTKAWQATIAALDALDAHP